MKDYFEQSIRALQLAGMSERTQGCYTRAVRILVDFYGKPPDQITEMELEDYFLHRRNTDKWSAAIIECRTEAAGIAVYECLECREHSRVNWSCGNRHCSIHTRSPGGAI